MSAMTKPMPTAGIRGRVVNERQSSEVSLKKRKFNKGGRRSFITVQKQPLLCARRYTPRPTGITPSSEEHSALCIVMHPGSPLFRQANGSTDAANKLPGGLSSLSSSPRSEILDLAFTGSGYSSSTSLQSTCFHASNVSPPHMSSSHLIHHAVCKMGCA